MLFEDFLNRYISKKFNRLAFPSIIFPWMLILGIFMMITSPLIFLLDESDWLNPDSLFMACYMTGLGFFGGSIFTGCFWGLMKERLSQGYLRPNFGTAFSLYVVLMVFCWFHVYLFVGRFLYLYPSQKYLSYIIEVKPTAELEAEIERLGLYEVKQHTPFNYSLDRQTIRYDFLDRSGAAFSSRKDMFFQAVNYYKGKEGEWVFDESKVPVNIGVGVGYPKVFNSEDGGYKCGVVLTTKVEWLKAENSVTGNAVLLEKIKDEADSGIYDVSSIFVASSSGSTCFLRHDGSKAMAEFFVKRLFLPQTYSHVYSIKVRDHRHFDFGHKHFRAAIRNL